MGASRCEDGGGAGPVLLHGRAARPGPAAALGPGGGGRPRPQSPLHERGAAEDLFSEIFSHLTKCRTCKGMFTFGDLEKHAQACLNSVHATSKCSQCRKKFSGLNKLAKHKKKTHNMDKVSKEGYVDKNTKRICINHSIFSSTS